MKSVRSFTESLNSPCERVPYLRDDFFTSSCFALEQEASGIKIWSPIPCVVQYKKNKPFYPTRKDRMSPVTETDDLFTVTINTKLPIKIDPEIVEVPEWARAIHAIYLNQSSWYSIYFDNYKLDGLIHQIQLDITPLTNHDPTPSFRLACEGNLIQTW